MKHIHIHYNITYTPLPLSIAINKNDHYKIANHQYQIIKLSKFKKLAISNKQFNECCECHENTKERQMNKQNVKKEK